MARAREAIVAKRLLLVRVRSKVTYAEMLRAMNQQANFSWIHGQLMLERKQTSVGCSEHSLYDKQWRCLYQRREKATGMLTSFNSSFHDVYQVVQRRNDHASSRTPYKTWEAAAFPVQIQGYGTRGETPKASSRTAARRSFRIDQPSSTTIKSRRQRHTTISTTTSHCQFERRG